jgi:hypothetical protein
MGKRNLRMAMEDTLRIHPPLGVGAYMVKALAVLVSGAKGPPSE